MRSLSHLQENNGMEEEGLMMMITKLHNANFAKIIENLTREENPALTFMGSKKNYFLRYLDQQIPQKHLGTK